MNALEHPAGAGADRGGDGCGRGDLSHGGAGGRSAIPRIDIAGCEREPRSETIHMMANISEYSIVAYHRKSGHWRAAVFRKIRSGILVNGAMVFSIVTPDDSASELEAEHEAERLISKL
jgi:hypothetical protein